MFSKFGHWCFSALLLLAVNTLLFIHSYPISLIILLNLISVIFFVIQRYLQRNARQNTINLIDTLLISLRSGDYAVRAHQAKDKQLAATVEHLNALAEAMHADQRALAEQDDLLNQIIEKIDCALIVFNKTNVAFANSYAKRTLSDCYQADIESWFENLLERQSQGKVTINVSGIEHAFLLEYDQCFIANQSHTLLVLKQLDTILYQQEKDALQRFVRILSHEVNNALAPIGTVARSLTKRLKVQFDEERFESGLQLINERASYLKSFMGNYASLAKLPNANKQVIKCDELCEQLQNIYADLSINIEPELLGFFDVSQIKQVLCHLINNAYEANSQGCDVALFISSDENHLKFCIQDTGPGFSNLKEAAEAFYTTKPNGNGIGLMLSRIILEKHGSYLQLSNRECGGAEVKFSLEKVDVKQEYEYKK